MQLLTVLNQSGGCGKTTAAVHLACWLAERNANVAFIDADPQARSTHWLKRAAPGILCLPAIEAGEVHDAVERLKAGDDLTVIADAKPGLDGAALELLKLSDRVYMPIVPSEINLDSTAQALATMKALEVRKPVVLYLSIVDPGGEATRARLRLAELARESGGPGVTAAAASIGRRMVFRAAYSHGTVAWRMKAVSSSWSNPAKLACAELDALFTEILPHGILAIDRPAASASDLQDADRYHVAA
ncbi:MAG TPA: ParA family protein [Tepidisphaeraceae bacterium]|jgi:chromosome partitioning protein|nr:ParA family protein [Tepidisphaeraceae bacterium]